jgi:hypothetical protein
VCVQEDGVDTDQQELIWRLCTEAGSIFEDASATAVLIRRAPADDLAATIRKLRAMTHRAEAMLAAASSLIE